MSLRLRVKPNDLRLFKNDAQHPRECAFVRQNNKKIFTERVCTDVIVEHSHDVDNFSMVDTEDLVGLEIKEDGDYLKKIHVYTKNKSGIANVIFTVRKGEESRSKVINFDVRD